ncbi:MAG: nitroreductase family protein, partial [Treponemataceae bacterium]|nr:nitroreductase family protein [Treponemataceae bacterium]
MTFLELARNRRSVRKFKDEPVDAELMKQVLEAARAAPTAANMQPVRLIVVQSSEAKEKLSHAANCYGAPISIIVCSDRSRAWKRPFDGKSTAAIDASSLTDHMMLCAADIGLAGVWICYVKPDVVRKAFNMPEGWAPVNILALGRAYESPAP